jgi:hypothetical protein
MADAAVDSKIFYMLSAPVGSLADACLFWRENSWRENFLTAACATTTRATCWPCAHHLSCSATGGRL